MIYDYKICLDLPYKLKFNAECSDTNISTMVSSWKNDGDFIVYYVTEDLCLYMYSNSSFYLASNTKLKYKTLPKELIPYLLIGSIK